MSQLKSYIAHAIWGSVLAVLIVIVSLDAISSLVDQLGNLKNDYGFGEAILYVLLSLPSSIYRFLPISALVGCLVGLGSLASSSELVVMRAAGVSVNQIIWAVARPVLVFIFIAVLIGEYVAPYADQYADSRRSLAQGHNRALQSEGLWILEDNEYMHFNVVLPNGKLFGITRFKFNESGQLQEASFVDSAIYQGDYWFEQDGVVTQFLDEKIDHYEFSTRRWYTEVSPALLNVRALDVRDLPMQRLYAHSSYREKQGLDASEYRLAFWQKALQPFATLSLVMIAISFILGPLRQVTMGFRVFIGVIVGLAFQTSQKLLGPASIIMGFSPMFAVLVPVLLCFVIGFLFLRRAQ